MLRTPTVSVPETPTRVLTGAQLWGNASAIAAHGRWVRGFTNASVIINNNDPDLQRVRQARERWPACL